MNRKGIWVLAVIMMVAAGCAPKADNPKDVAAIKEMSTAWGQAATKGRRGRPGRTICRQCGQALSERPDDRR